jgi:hypothetical protein
MQHQKPIDVTIVMPVLNEATSLPHCIANARAALERIEARFGLTGEILVADNGSSDGSPDIAVRLGASVAFVDEKGYGAALIGGFQAASGRFLVMGDADGSYNFDDAVPMIEQLLAGADLCMGNRFCGTIAPGAMPWKNRYIGNPLLTGVLNLFFRSGVHDAHCGLRAMTRSALTRLNLTGKGMEFASEMVIKASLKHLRIAQVPVTLSPDIRGRPPHLRPWRDGWRHLRYLLMLSPTWVFGMPALGAIGTAGVILLTAALHSLGLLAGDGPFGASWIIIAAFLFTGGHFAAIMALATHFHGVKQGYRSLRPILRTFAPLLTLETMLMGGSVLIVGSVGMMVLITYHWSTAGFSPLPNLLPLVLTAMAGATGLQTIFGGFVLAIIAGHVADFANEASRVTPSRLIVAPKAKAAAPGISVA